MTEPLQQFCRDEYARFRADLISRWAVDTKQIGTFDAQLKPIHKRYLSLACAATVIGHRTKPKEYAEGAIEVGNLSMVLAVKGLENPSCVLLRQCIELVLKHVYFESHPVEYGWACSREDYRDLTFQFLLEYIRRTKEYRTFEPGDRICQRLDFWFGTLSRHVHVHSKGFMGYINVGSACRPRQEVLKKLNERTKELWPLLTTLLVVHFPAPYLGASVVEQRLIKGGLPKGLRDLVTGYLRSLSET